MNPIPHLSLPSARDSFGFHKLEKAGHHPEGEVLKTLSMGSAV